MKYKLYQIKLTSAEVDQVNETGHNSVPKQKAKMDMIMCNEDINVPASQAFKDGYFEHVANINANDLEDVFEVGNIGPEEQIERFKPMHSVSVGDIVIDESGNKSVVASLGFQNVA